MKKQRGHFRIRRGLASVLCFLAFVCLADLGALAQEQISLGGISYGRVPAQPLRRAVTRNPGFFRIVGGVAFEATAVGKDGLLVTKLDYVDERADGARLVVTIDNGSGVEVMATGRLYDWQLVPIAKFAASDYGSAVTLFGELLDENAQANVHENGGWVINYHEALDNTLLGLRLLQADALLFQPHATDLFKDAKGEYILGAGESPPDINANKTRFAALHSWLEDKEAHRSYVVGDLDQDITFYISEGNKLAFTGYPYWWLWRDSEQVSKDIELLKALEMIEDEQTKSEVALTLEDLSNAIEIIETFEEGGGDYDAFAARLSTYFSSGELVAPVNQLKELSQLTTDKVRELKGINPIVYKALKDTMHYSALFRHFRSRNETAYSEFVDSLSSVPVLPAVVTPTVQYGEGQ